MNRDEVINTLLCHARIETGFTTLGKLLCFLEVPFLFIYFFFPVIVSAKIVSPGERFVGGGEGWGELFDEGYKGVRCDSNSSDTI